MEKLLTEIAAKNAQIAELTKQKNEIKSNIGITVEEAEIEKMQNSL